MDPHQQGLEAAEQRMDARDYGGALVLYRELAESGSASAQCCLGTLLLYGIGDYWDIEAGLAWLRRAGEQGDAWAWLNIGTAYSGGIGTLPADLAKAHEYYRRAIAAGCPYVPWLEPLTGESSPAPVSLEQRMDASGNRECS